MTLGLGCDRVLISGIVATEPEGGTTDGDPGRSPTATQSGRVPWKEQVIGGLNKTYPSVYYHSLFSASLRKGLWLLDYVRTGDSHICNRRRSLDSLNLANVEDARSGEYQRSCSIPIPGLTDRGNRFSVKYAHSTTLPEGL
jgi:hypothetical protein